VVVGFLTKSHPKPSMKPTPKQSKPTSKQQQQEQQERRQEEQPQVPNPYSSELQGIPL